MKPGLVLAGGALILIAGIVAFALNKDSREAEATDTPDVVETTPVEEEEVELADPGVIPVEPVLEGEELPEGYVVDEDGFVWEPLSFDKPQIKHNPDGTITMKKLARIHEPDGTMREVAITGHAAPDQRRLPVMRRTKGAERTTGPPAPEDEKKGNDGH